MEDTIMLRRIENPLKYLFATILIMALAPLAYAQPPGRHGHNFPHPKTKKYRSLKQRDVKKEQIAHLYGNHECPVSGETVVPESFVDYKDDEHNAYARIYLCCDHCVKKTEEQLPELYYKLYRTDKEKGKEVEARDLQNATCPVMEDEPVSPEVAIEYNGMVIHFHHSECIAAFLDDPEPGMKRLLPNAKEFEYKRPKAPHN
jgi:hypothetical protein